MKKTFLMIVFSMGMIVISAQELTEPTFHTPFTEKSGNFLVVTTFDKIGKSDISIDYINKLQQEINESKKIIAEQAKQLNDEKRTISEMQKQINDNKKTIAEIQKQINEQRKELDDLKRTVSQLVRKVEDLERKVK